MQGLWSSKNLSFRDNNSIQIIKNYSFWLSMMFKIIEKSTLLSWHTTFGYTLICMYELVVLLLWHVTRLVSLLFSLSEFLYISQFTIQEFLWIINSSIYLWYSVICSGTHRQNILGLGVISTITVYTVSYFSATVKFLNVSSYALIHCLQHRWYFSITL